MKTVTRALFLSLLMLFCVDLAVVAQEESDDSKPSDPAPSAEDATATEPSRDEEPGPEAAITEEIVVTAQKREQSAQDVGISIVALPAQELDSLGVREARDLTEFIPNVELATSGDSDIPIFVIRGVGLQDYNTNNTPTTALVVDDVYQPFGVYGSFSLFDTDRVEVLRGPQGGLYGRNSTGGAVSMVSRRPPQEGTEANVAVDLGSYGTANVRAGIGFRLSESVGARIAVDRASSEGYYYNTYLNRHQGGKDRTQARLTLEFEPSDDFVADLRVTYGADQSEVAIPELAGYLDPNVRWAGPDDVLALGSPPMNVPFNPDGTPAFCQAVLETGIPDATCVTANGFAPDGIYRGGESSVGKFDDEFTAFALNMDWNLDAFTLTSISSYATMDFRHTNGTGAVGIADYQNPEAWAAFGAAVGRANGGVPDPNYVTRYDSTIESWSQELRVLSPADVRVGWMLGAVYAKDQLAENRDCEFPANLYFDYEVFPGCGLLVYDQDTTAWSAYGQLVLPLTDRLSVTTDLRYTDEKKEYRDGGVWINDGAWLCATFGLDPETCAAFVPEYDLTTNLFELAVGANADYKKQEPSYKVNLDFASTPNLLLYASAGRTFKSGGFFGGFFFLPDAIVSYGPETNTAIEAGFKSTLAGGTVLLNGSVFHYDYKDFQGNLTAQSKTAGGGAVFSGLKNLGDAETLGAELDFRWSAPHGFELGLGAGYLDSEITKVARTGFDDPDTIVGVTNILSQVVDIVGNDLDHAPKFTANALARYSFRLTDSLGASAQVTTSWTDDYYLSVTNEPWSRVESFTLIDALVEVYRGSNSLWTVGLWGKNLTDKHYRLATYDDGIFSNYSVWNAPRNFGVTLGYRF